MAGPEDFDRDADILPDEILEKHFEGEGGGPPTAVADEPPDPASEDDEIDPDDSFEDMPEEGPEDEIEDDEEFEDGGDELDEELEDYDLDDDDDLDDEDFDEEDEEFDEDEDEDLEADEEDVLEDQVTPEDHERIKKDPSLRRIHKEMQRAFTKKTQAVSARDREVSAREERNQAFEKALSSPQGMADYIANTMTQRPDIIGAAFEQIATGEAGFDFLVEVGLHDTEMLDRAYDRVRELESDPDELDRHRNDRQQRRRQSELDAREERLRRRTFDKSVSRIESQAEAEAKRLKIEPDEMEHVTSRLKAKIRERTGDDGSVDLSRNEIRAIAKEARQELDRIYDRAKKRLNRKRAKQSRKATKSKARRAKGRKRVPPRSKAKKTPKQHARFKPSEDGDGLDEFIDHRLDAM